MKNRIEDFFECIPNFGSDLVKIAVNYLLSQFFLFIKTIAKCEIRITFYFMKRWRKKPRPSKDVYANEWLYA